ncbi:hypothetical protein HY772_09605 [Candidatus Woesearchaeota archaeon]|nr:hypothetical protein [Candidatus Woesearchaeota archaeon]
MDVIFPDDNEKEFLEIAKRLGVQELCLVYNDISSLKKVSALQGNTGIKLYSGAVCSPQNIAKYKGKAEFVFVNAGDHPDKVRDILEHGHPDVVFDLECTAKRDFMHHRASGLNQVHCALMAKNNIALGMSVSSVLHSSCHERAKILGRMGQNVWLARKYKLKVLFASFAREPYEMRAGKDIESLCRAIG